MFRSLCAHHQEVKIVLHSVWYHHTYRLVNCYERTYDVTLRRVRATTVAVKKTVLHILRATFNLSNPASKANATFCHL